MPLFGRQGVNLCMGYPHRSPVSAKTSSPKRAVFEARFLSSLGRRCGGLDPVTMWVSHAHTSVAGEEEECFSELVPLQLEGLGACETIFPPAQGRRKKLVTEDSNPVGSGRFRDQTRDAEAVPGLVLSLLIQDLLTYVSLLCREVNSRHPCV